MTTPDTTAAAAERETTAYDVAIVGAGYVGVPLAQVFAQAGRSVVLVEVDAARVDQLNRGESYIEDVPSELLGSLVRDGGLAATTDYDVLRDTDAILIALPTPLSKQREPDLSIVLDAAAQIGRRLRPGHLVVLESTTYPGTTRDALQPVLERESGLRAGADFHLAFSPERVDPGRVDWTTKTVPKVVGGVDERVDRRRGRALRLGRRHRPPRLVARGRRAHEAPGEHLPLGQHRARQRARAALRPDGDRHLGGRRRGRHEAVRLHALPAGPGPRRALHPDRPLLPHLEGPRVRLLDAVHRAGGRGQPEHAVLLPLARLAGAQPRGPQVARRSAGARARGGLQVRHRGLAGVAGREADPPARQRGRAMSTTTTTTSPRSPPTGSRSPPCRSSRRRTTSS